MARARALRPRKPRIPGVGTAPRFSWEKSPQLPGMQPRAKPNKPGVPTGGDPKEGFIPPGSGVVGATGKPPKPSKKPPKGSKGKGKKGKGKGAQTVSYQTQAEREMQAIYGPVLGSYAELIKSRQAEAAAEAARKQAVYAAFAKYYQETAPKQIGGIYQQAATDQAAWAKGYSLGMQLAQQELAESANKQIHLAGGVGQQITPGPEAANVIYGLGGAIPASTLSQQGAAFSAAAALQSPAIFAEGGRQASELLKLSSQEIEKLRFEELQVRTEMRAKVFELTQSYREAGQKARADRLEALQDEAEYLTEQTGFIHLVVKGRVRNTRQLSVDVALKKAALDQAQQRLDKHEYRVIGSDKAGRYLLDLTTGTKTLLQNPIATVKGAKGWREYRTKRGTIVRVYRDGHTEERIAPAEDSTSSGTGIYSKSTGIELTKDEIKSFGDDVLDTIRDGKRLGLKPFQILEDLNDSPIPIEIWGPIAARRFNIRPNANPAKLKYEALFRLAAFWGFIPAPGWRGRQGRQPKTDPATGDVLVDAKGNIIYEDKDTDPKARGASRQELIAFIRQARAAFSPKARAAQAAAGGGGDTAEFTSFSQGGDKMNWLASLWVQAGGDPNVANTAAAIAMAESGGRVDAWNPRGLDKSAGLWQINYHGALRAPRTRQFGPPELLRRDPLANAKAAVAIYKSAGGSFRPWTTYTSGAYKQYLGGGGQFVSDTGQGGAWGGTLRIADQGKAIASKFGLSASGKRSTKLTSSGGVSDHWTGSKNAFAYDLSGTRNQMHKAAFALTRSLGINWDGLSELIEDVYIGPFRIQIIYNTPKYGGHMDHIHFGVRRVSGGQSI